MDEKTSYHIIWVLFLLSFIWIAGVHFGYGQTSLSAGDIAFTGMNVDNDENFAIVVLKDIPGEENVYFSNKEWDGNAFSGSGGYFSWLVPSAGVTAGSIVIFNHTAVKPTATVGTITGHANTGLSSRGDVLYAYTGSSQSSPDTFLGAIATSADEYNGGEATLDNSGLTQGSTAILLPDNITHAEYTGSRSGNTLSGYRKLLNDVGSEEATDDNWDIYNGRGTQPSPPFNSQQFNFVDPPALHFTDSSDVVNEDDGSIDLTVELAESTGEAVNAEVAFLSGASSADDSDIGDYTMQKISFPASASAGNTKTVAVNITNPSTPDYEDDEKAVFQLQNPSKGNIVAPQTLTLTIKDDDVPPIVINEINADPADDADGNGSVDSHDEFVEMVNTSSSDIDLSGWTFYEGTGGSEKLRHTFPEATVIGAGKAIVLFSGDDSNPQGNFGGAVVQRSNESATISLNNGGDTLTLKDAKGNIVTGVTYSNAGNDQSINLAPELNTNSKYSSHSAVSGSNGSLSSPGTRVDGTSFGGGYAVAFRGREGWRMVASPVKNATFKGFFSDFWMQGFQGSDDPSGAASVFLWNESGSGSFNAPTSVADQLEPGKGYIVYAFDDGALNTPGIQGGFPKIVHTDALENSGTLNVSVSSDDANGNGNIDQHEGWNLLGNPFPTDISAGAVIDALVKVNSNVNANLYIWDHDKDGGNGQYVTLHDGDHIAPFQGFFVRYTSSGVSGTADFRRSNLEAHQGAEYYKQNGDNLDKHFDLQLHERGGKHYFDDYMIKFSNKGKLGLDRYDAYKLFSLNEDAISLFSMNGSNRLQKNELPRNFNDKITIPLSFDANGRGKLKFTWKHTKDLPSDWNVRLVDHKMNSSIDLRTRRSYQFTVSETKINTQKFQTNKDTLRNKVKAKDIDDNRFELIISTSSLKSDDGNSADTKKVSLEPNYPNPFRTGTTIPVKLEKKSKVTLTVWNMIGQKISTLKDHQMMKRGTTGVRCSMGNYPSGIYIARLQVDGKTYIRKMTLIK